MRHLARLLCLSLLLAACSAPPAAPTTPATPATPTTPPPATLTVFAAASLTESFGELGQLFEARRPGVTVVFNFAGSQQLVQQLAQDAPADVFASANNRQMQAAVETGRVDAASPQTFVHNRLVVVTPADNRAGLASFADLARPGLKLVLAAPEVPVGQYAQEFLELAGQDPALGADFVAGVTQNIVSYEENVRAVLSKVALGEADAGIVYATDAASAGDAVRILPIPDALNVVASYPLAPIANSAQAELAAQFIALVLSPEGRAVLARYGFDPAPQP
ncbi:MAG: molybdate ABC transporter substrate-binding protein [Anaerolinea sp.]|nr:molybdate ABC transporter substrate-binding protein [Anaerolinea sp.]